MKKKIALVGASGFIGSHVLVELSKRGYEVVAIARNTSVIKSLPNVELVSLDVNEIDKLTNIFEGCDAVISAFNSDGVNETKYENYLNGAQHIQEAANRAGKKRYIFIGCSGSLYENNIQLVDSDNFSLDNKPEALAARDYLTELKIDKDLEWSYFCPPLEISLEATGKRRGEYRVKEKNPVYNDSLRSILSVEDVAVAVVDELENNNHIRKQFTAGY